MEDSRARRTADRAQKRQRQLEECRLVVQAKPKRQRHRSASSPETPASEDASKENNVPLPVRACTAVKIEVQPAPQYATQPEPLRCRDAEARTLTDTLKAALTTEQAAALYVPGQPGTGKTHTVRHVLQGMPCSTWEVEQPIMALINCQDRPSRLLGRVILAGLYDCEHLLKARRGNGGAPCMMPRLLPFSTCGIVMEHVELLAHTLWL
jgi:transcriptional regulator of acetoin/glycerol metabolism